MSAGKTAMGRRMTMEYCIHQHRRDPSLAHRISIQFIACPHTLFAWLKDIKKELSFEYQEPAYGSDPHADWTLLAGGTQQVLGTYIPRYLDVLGIQYHIQFGIFAVQSP